MNLVGVGLKKKLNSFNWRDLSENKALPWSLELIEKFEDKWSWIYHGSMSADESDDRTTGLIINNALPWTLELIDKFKDHYKWRWEYLCDNALACLPELSIQDIDEVMSYHFPLELLAKQTTEPIKSTLDDLDDDLPF